MAFSPHIHLLSLRLWHRIQRPSPRNPLYKRAALHGYTPPNRLLNLLREVVEVFFASPLVMVTFPFIPFVLMLLNTVNGIRLAAAASTIIYDERQRGTLDLLTLIPSGKREAIWLLSLGSIHQTTAYLSLVIWRRYIGRIIPASLSLYALLLALNTLPNSAFVPTLRNGMFFLVIIPCVAALLLEQDNLQATVTAAVTGLLMSTNARNRGEAQAIAGVLFAAQQVFFYTLVMLALLLPLRSVSVSAFVDHPKAWNLFMLQGAAYLLVVCVAYIGLRDMCIRALWRAYQRHLYN